MTSWYEAITDRVLFGTCLFILAGCVYITIRTKFVQIRALPFLWKELKRIGSERFRVQGKHTVSPLRALFAAMSTTLGISTLVGPVIAVRLGGPGAVLGFLITAFLGSAVTYTEVFFAVSHRKTRSEGKISGGPMPYLSLFLSSKAAKFYAFGCAVLMAGWSAAQANQLASVLASKETGSIPEAWSALGIIVLVMGTLLGGIRRIGAFSAKIVPLMFSLYIGSSLWIVFSNTEKILPICSLMIRSVFEPYAAASGICVGGAVAAFRWGIFKGLQTTEAGVGTQTIPHSLAETADPHRQATLAMLSTFGAGGLAFLSGFVALLTGTWEIPGIGVGMPTVIASYREYFSWPGVMIIVSSAFLFGFGTILGNAFNGGQCYDYLTGGKKKRYYYALTAVVIFLGAVGEVRVVWSAVDIVLAWIAIPHMAALLVGITKRLRVESTQKG